MITTVIFDMDGVIYDSTPYTWEARKIYLSKYNIKLRDKEIPELLGNSFRDMMGILNKKYNLSLEFDDFSKKTREIQVELMKNYLKPNEGIRELIDDLLKNNVKIAIASNNLRRFIEEDLEIMNLRDKFEIITSVEEVKNYKPHPEIFLETAKKLNSLPTECVVIEDSNVGIEAAKRANMKTIAHPTKFNKKENFKGVNLIVNSLKELNWGIIKDLDI
jgi:HAD superfamily hydrolase (TIGR01509 family)